MIIFLLEYLELYCISCLSTLLYVSLLSRHSKSSIPGFATLRCQSGGITPFRNSLYMFVLYLTGVKLEACVWRDLEG